MKIQPGTLLQNRYRVIKQVGAGGMGAVYVATDERFQSTVAIKRTFFEDANLRKAFEREAHLLNRLRHPALPKVSDYFAEGEEQFLVMEYIEGSDIAELLKERRAAFPLADVLRWADELLDALEYLHTHEPPVVHRDIKPQNLKLTPRGQIVLLDFGLAKGAGAGATHTATASVFGYSPNYAPLEQMQGTGTDTRSDLYSLAATLYHMMTGFLPVDALARAGATVKHQPDPLKPAHLAHAQVPESVSKVLRRAMSQNAAMRHGSAADLRAALRQATPAGMAPRAAARPAQASAAFAQARTAPFDATVLEHSASPARPAEKSVVGDTTRFAQRSADSFLTALAPSKPPAARISPARIVGGLAVVLVVACVVAGSYLLMRPSAAQTPSGSDTRSKTRPGASAPSETDASAATETSTTVGDVPNTSTAERANQPQQSTRASDDAGSGGAQAASADSVTSGFADTGGGSVAPSSGVSSSTPASVEAERPALVIQNPTPAEETRRAEEAQPRPTYPQPYPSEYERRPPPEGGFRPPPPDGRRPPPPGHRPPPRP